jgi:hypothetical protein
MRRREFIILFGAHQCRGSSRRMHLLRPRSTIVQPTAFRKNVRDVLKFRAPVFGNVKLT